MEKKRTYSNKARATYFFDREMDKKEKEEIIRNLYWDYDIVPAVVLKLIEHPNEGDEAKLRKLFIRAFENLRWHELVSLFGIDTVEKLCTNETREGLRKEARQRFDIACAILRGEPIPSSRQDTENRKLALKPFLSNRRYG